MPHRILDLQQTIRRNKAREKFLAFSGLRLSLEAEAEPKSGMVKIAGHARDDDSGYLCLTFLLDAPDEELSRKIRRTFARLSEHALRPLLGDGFIYLIEIGPDQERSWFVDEVYFYFRKVRGRRRDLLENRIMPALEQVLPLEFTQLEWWGAQEEDDDHLQHEKVESFMDHVRRILGVQGKT
jgi:hypothetical protein